MPALHNVAGGALAALKLERATLVIGLALAAGLGALAALVPVWRSARLSVIEGLVHS
jgi:hypothetical protein